MPHFVNSSNKIFVKGDYDASVGVFFDGFSKLLVCITFFVGVVKLDQKIIFGTMLPGIFFSILCLNGGLWLYYRHFAKHHQLTNLTAIPAGPQAFRIFVWLFSIILPTYKSQANALFAFKVGIAAHFISGIIFVLAIFVVPYVLKIIPLQALFGSIAGGAMAYMIIQSLNGIYTQPLIGWSSLLILLVLYFSKFEFKIPNLAIAIIVGMILAVLSGELDWHKAIQEFTGAGIYLPKFQFALLDINALRYSLRFLPLIIVFSFDEVITGIQAVEQARECGDEYFTVKEPLLICGVADIIGSLFGNPLAVGLYWGYPAWKQLKAGTGFHLGTILLYAVTCLTGLAMFFQAIIPLATVLPILVFIGLTSYAQAFEVVEHKYYPALIIATVPIITDFMLGTTTTTTLTGLSSLRAGAPMLGLILGAMLICIIDHKWLKLAAINCMAGILTCLGIIHAPGLIFTDNYLLMKDFVVLYFLSMLGFMLMHLFNRQTKPKDKQG